ncbi:c-type cytochrome [Trichothermofontia sp.]
MDEQQTIHLGGNVPIQRIAAILLAIGGAILAILFTLHQLETADPYIQSVLRLPGDRDRGAMIFQINCAGCHGSMADGLVGPSLKHIAERKTQAALIRQVISGETPPMPKFQPNPQEMADLLTYLESL